MDNNSGNHVTRLRQTFKPYRHFVEVASLIATNDSMFHNVLVLTDIKVVVIQLYSEAQRPVVENLISFVTIRHYHLVAVHQSRSTAA